VTVLGAVQTRCARCTALTPDYVNTATGLALHRSAWLEDDAIGALPALRWNHLIDAQEPPILEPEHGGPLAAEWFASRDAAFRLWD